MLKGKVTWLQLIVVTTALLIVVVVSVPLIVNQMVSGITKQQQAELAKLKQDNLTLQQRMLSAQSSNALPSGVGMKEAQTLSDMLKSGVNTANTQQTQPKEQSKETQTSGEQGFDPNASPYGLISKADTPVYAKPYTTATVVVKAADKEKVDILGKYNTKVTTSKNWYEVKLANGKTGYVQEEAIKANKAIEVSKVARSKGPTTNIRQTASTTAKKVGILSSGEFAKILENGTWLKIQMLDGTIGYVLSSIVTVEQ